MLIIVNLWIYRMIHLLNNCSWRIKLRSFCCRWNSNSTKRLMRKARGGGTCPFKSLLTLNIFWGQHFQRKSEWNHLKNPCEPQNHRQNLRETLCLFRNIRSFQNSCSAGIQAPVSADKISWMSQPWCQMAQSKIKLLVECCAKYLH